MKNSTQSVESILAGIQASIAQLAAVLAPQPQATTAPFPTLSAPGTSGAIRQTLAQQAAAKRGQVIPQAVTKTAPPPTKKAPTKQAPPSTYPATPKAPAKKHKNGGLRIFQTQSANGNPGLRINSDNTTPEDFLAALRNHGYTVSLNGGLQRVDREADGTVDAYGHPSKSRHGYNQSLSVSINGATFMGVAYLTEQEGGRLTAYAKLGQKRKASN